MSSFAVFVDFTSAVSTTGRVIRQTRSSSVFLLYIQIYGRLFGIFRCMVWQLMLNSARFMVSRPRVYYLHSSLRIYRSSVFVLWCVLCVPLFRTPLSHLPIPRSSRTRGLQATVARQLTAECFAAPAIGEKNFLARACLTSCNNPPPPPPCLLATSLSRRLYSNGSAQLPCYNGYIERLYPKSLADGSMQRLYPTVLSQRFCSQRFCRTTLTDGSVPTLLTNNDLFQRLSLNGSRSTAFQRVKISERRIERRSAGTAAEAPRRRRSVRCVWKSPWPRPPSPPARTSCAGGVCRTA